MKKLLFIIITVLCIACSSIKEYSFEPSYQFFKETETPQLVIDSLNISDSLLIYTDFRNWEEIQFFTSDSVIQKSYYIYDDSMKFSISVTKNKNEKYSVKYIR